MCIRDRNSTAHRRPVDRTDYAQIAEILRPDSQTVYLFAGHGIENKMAANHDISLTPSDTNTAKSTTSFIEKQDENEADRRANASKAPQEDTLLAEKSDEAGTQNQKPLDETLPEATAPSVAAKPVTPTDTHQLSSSTPATSAVEPQAKSAETEKKTLLTADESQEAPASVNKPFVDSSSQSVINKPHAPNSRKAARIEALRRKHAAKKLRRELAAQKAKAKQAQAEVQTSPKTSGPPSTPALTQPPSTGILPSSMAAAEDTGSAPTGPTPGVSTLPPLKLLASPVKVDQAAQEDWVVAQSDRLDKTLQAFNVDAHVVAHTVGPTVTQFQVRLASGVKVNKITNLNDDLKLALAAKDIRIEAPIPGKNTVGIEIPNLKPRPVMLREVLDTPAFQQAKSPLTIALGVDLFGQPVVTNLARMPHGLIAGATGSGKSVFINSLLVSLLYKATPEQVRLLLIDPKAVELAGYNGLPHLVSPVISDPKAASAALKWVVSTMNDRYKKLAAAGVRNLEQFNAKAERFHEYAQVLPYLVIIIDELADLMLAAGSEIQDDIARITAKARAAGIHLLVATQRPSVDVITGTIKNNIPTRIAFMTASQIDSRTIIDTAGAERLLGRGDMLYLGNGASQPIRLQGTFVDREIDAIVDYVKARRGPRYLFDPAGLVKSAEASVSHEDELMPEVLDYLSGERHISTSKLQRVFSIGYNRAANLIDALEAKHLVSPAKGAKPREVYYSQAKKEEQTS
ncbi:DNA translocase FtsK, partial [Lacticaseibacillus paracasei]|uniref:DNA translocase FtsK n=1 Tax=Lacticaseibacillus paracasei TaxID=1597 RepID=UPI00325BA2F9